MGTTTKIKICDTCKGQGNMWIVSKHARHGSDIEDGQWQNCQTCKGSGMVLITKHVNSIILPYKPDSHE